MKRKLIITINGRNAKCIRIYLRTTLTYTISLTYIEQKVSHITILHLMRI